MKADTVTLVQVFGTDRRFVVPIFQRPYVWNRDLNWETLWVDIRSAAEEVEAEGGSGQIEIDRVARSHFMGAVVLERLAATPGRIPAANVIDGQQRLTTLQVFLASCRATVKSLGMERPEIALSKLVQNPDELIHSDHAYERYKVWPSLPDRDAYRAVFAQVPPPAERDEHLLIQARRYFDEELQSWFSDARDDVRRADALVIAIRERLTLVEIQLEEQDDAQIIFETLNDRGTRLQAADLVKNTVFRLAETQGETPQTLYDEHWKLFDQPTWRAEVTTGRIHRTRIDVLLSYWLSIISGSEVPVERLFTDFKLWLRRTAAPAKEVLADLAHHGRAYQRMENLQSTDPTGRLLETLSLTNTTTPIPLMLHLYARDDVPAEQRAIAAKSIESYLVRRMVAGLTTKDYNRLFLLVLQQVREATSDIVGDRVRQLLADQTAASRYWPSDAEFARDLQRPGIYQLLRGARLRILLGGIESALRSNKSEMPFAPANLNKINVEHLLPQKWSQYYPLPTDVPFDEAEVRRHEALHSLGNLTLTTAKLNSAISNGSWPTKRRELGKHSVLLITAATVLQPPPTTDYDLAARWLDEWDERRISVRGAYLAGVAAQAWPRP